MGFAHTPPRDRVIPHMDHCLDSGGLALTRSNIFGSSQLPESGESEIHALANRLRRDTLRESMCRRAGLQPLIHPMHAIIFAGRTPAQSRAGAVIRSVMPKGVEQERLPGDARRDPQVIRSVMPKGVEQIKRIGTEARVELE